MFGNQLSDRRNNLTFMLLGMAMIALLVAEVACANSSPLRSSETDTSITETTGSTNSKPARVDEAPQTKAEVFENSFVPSPARSRGSLRLISPGALLWVAHSSDRLEPERTVSATARSTRQFFVDSAKGDDLRDGRSEQPGTGAAGPWRTLARAMQGDLGPGDTLILACGSIWHETLRLPRDGSSENPISVRSPTGGCGPNALPAIDGSREISPERWTNFRGSVVQASFPTPPYGVTYAGRTMPEAHHPNLTPRHINSAETYLRTAADSRVVKARGQEASTEVIVGPDLNVPPNVRLGDGARVRIRTLSWLIDESDVQELNGNRLVLSKPTSYPLKAGWGYFLLGQLWMVDSPGEWFHDRNTGTLYFWPPEGVPRSEAIRLTTLAVGIDLRSRRFVTVNGLAVRYVRTGVQMPDSHGIEIINSTFDRITYDGIDAHGSRDAKLASNSFNRIGGNAIEGGGRHNGPSNRLSAIGNVILNSGIEIEGENVISLPRNSYAGILAGPNATVLRNTIADVGYIGIRVRSGSRVEENLISGACSVLDDCGGIYVWSDRAVRIARNTVLHTRGNTAGKPSNEASQGRGIYLDESVNRSVVDSNVVVDADHGLMIHVSSNNSLVGNFLYGNRSSQVWMQVTRNRERPTGDLYGNDVSNNVIAAMDPDSVGFRLENPFGELSGFGQFRGNRFFDRNSTAPIDLKFLGVRRQLTIQEWRQGFVGLPAERDGAGWAASDSGFATYSISGTNLIPTRSGSNSGWVTWNANPPASYFSWRDCAPGRCISVVPGGSSTVLSSPSFDLLKDKWYRLTVDVRAENDGQALELIVRRGGGGNNGYESLSHKRLASTADRHWRRISMVFRATKTVLAGDPQTGDIGARVDLEQLVTGRSIEVSNLEVVPITFSSTAAASVALVNPGSSTALIDCPFSSGLSGLCRRLFNARDNGRVRWPVEVPAYSATLIYGEEESLSDADRDGIADSADRCPMTRPGASVNSAGCPLLIQ